MADAMDGPRVDDDAAFDLLADLERQTPDQIRRQRASDRVTMKARVVVQPANSSDAMKLRVQCVTGDLSAGGCRLMSPIPLAVGDVYRMKFEGTDIDLPIVFARCLRCRLIREDAFEAGFAFFSPVNLAPRKQEESEDDLLSGLDDRKR